jgi:hypothetical protein
MALLQIDVKIQFEGCSALCDFPTSGSSVKGFPCLVAESMENGDPWIGSNEHPWLASTMAIALAGESVI